MRSAPNFGDTRLPERFWSKVAPCPISGCWIWTAALRPDGYGVFGVGGHTIMRAHRLAYAALVGGIPAGLTLDHLCRVRPCCNPCHLEAVTAAENSLRGESPPARNATKTHCSNGHLFDERNTVVKPGHRRQCRTCNYKHRRDWWRRRAEQGGQNAGSR